MIKIIFLVAIATLTSCSNKKEVILYCEVEGREKKVEYSESIETLLVMKNGDSILLKPIYFGNDYVHVVSKSEKTVTASITSIEVID